MPRRIAWALYAVAAVFALLAAIRDGGSLAGWPRWFADAAIGFIALAGFAWTLPGQPPTVP
jgi:hypothetical protein